MSGHAEVDGGIPVTGGDLAHLGEFLPRRGEADLQALGLAGPAFAVCFLDAGQQVVVDFGEPEALGRVGTQQRAEKQLCSWMQGVP
jgi:hypothetical protein